MTQALARVEQQSDPAVIEQALMGNLDGLDSSQRAQFIVNVCNSLGLNPMTQPFEYIRLNGKLRLYAKKDCTDQLRKLNKISIQIAARENVGDVYVVTARATDATGRADESVGAVPIGNAKGDNLANALMKAETKAKRRVTLSICGLGFLDESELETVKDKEPADPPANGNGKKVGHSATIASLGKRQPPPVEPRASKAQVDELKALLTIVPQEDSIIAGWLKKANAAELQDLSASQISKCIDWVKAKGNIQDAEFVATVSEYIAPPDDPT